MLLMSVLICQSASKVDCIQDYFRYLDILVFVEATIYAVDEANESLAKSSLNPQQAHIEGEPLTEAQDPEM